MSRGGSARRRTGALGGGRLDHSGAAPPIGAVRPSSAAAHAEHADDDNGGAMNYAHHSRRYILVRLPSNARVQLRGGRRGQGRDSGRSQPDAGDQPLVPHRRATPSAATRSWGAGPAAGRTRGLRTVCDRDVARATTLGCLCPAAPPAADRSLSGSHRVLAGGAPRDLSGGLDAAPPAPPPAASRQRSPGRTAFLGAASRVPCALDRA